MNCKQATIWGVLLWVLIFAAFSAIMFSPALEGKETLQQTIELIVLPVLVLFSSYMYFKGEKPSVKEGVILGFYFIVVGTILDLLITIPSFVKSYSEFYSQWALWFGFLETIVFSAIVGYYLEKKPKP